MSLPRLFDLDGAVAVVTGASGGLGTTIASTLAEAGAGVVLAGRNETALEATRRKLTDSGARAVAVVADVTDPEQCEHVAQQAIEHLGRLDYLVNNAGVASAVPALREPPEEFVKVHEVNLFGTYWMAQACARRMDDGGAIVNISSALAVTTAGLPQAAYTSSKTAVLGLTRDLAQQWTGRKAIRVNAIAPGFMPTEMVGQSPEGYTEHLGGRILCGRLARLEEVAASVLFLLSDAGGYITGQTLVVDGGFSLT